MSYLEKYGHGGDLQTAWEQFGWEPDQVLDFSANINPLGPPREIMQSLREELESIRSYPDPAHRRFRQALSAKLGVSLEWLLVGNGAAECMALAIQSIEPRLVGVIYPCFSEYVQFAEQYGAEVKGCFGQEPDYKPEPNELKRLLKEVDLLFIGHPNNPTGISYRKDKLVEIARYAQEYGTYLVIDEAFLDFLVPKDQVSLLPILEQLPHVILIRSMTKFYAIPGLRLGFAIANPALITGMRQKQITWSVNQFALLAGEACLDLDTYERQTRQLIVTERTFLQKEIEYAFGWRVWPGEANFLLVQLPGHMTASELQSTLGKEGILIRNCAMYPGLTPQHFRIAVRTRRENERLLEAMQRVTRQGGGKE